MTQKDVKKEGWSAEDLGEESSYEDETEISRRLRRGDETEGDPDARDVAGAVGEEHTHMAAKGGTNRRRRKRETIRAKT